MTGTRHPKNAGLEVRNLVKSYTGVTVLQGVSLAVAPGEVIGLVGHNGAGKSTLMRLISGAANPDSGTIVIDGVEAAYGSPASAIAAGISTVYQELSLLPDLTVTQNVFLGAELRRNGFLDARRMRAATKALTAELRIDVDPDRRLGDYPVATRQLLEIAIVAKQRKARYLLLDEPTTSLEGSQVDRFLDTVAGLAAEGIGIILVDHKLDELYRVASRVVALVDGEVRIDADVASVDRQSVILAIAGEEAVSENSRTAATARQDGPIALKVENLRSGVLTGVSCQARQGRVLGIYGLVGAGRTELLRAVAGIDKPSAGRIELDGSVFKPTSPRSAMRRGVVYVTEERKADGIIPQLDSSLNAMLPVLSRNTRFGIISYRALRRAAGDIMNQLRVRGDRTAPVATLSGGNQQKVILARALAQRPRILLLDEPTKGVDLGVKAEIHEIIRRLAHDDNLTVVLVSSEEEEICEVADDVLVMSAGIETGPITPVADVSPSSLRRAAWGADEAMPS
jgi:ABC-type sugar transport system ATPase subunit